MNLRLSKRNEQKLNEKKNDTRTDKKRRENEVRHIR